MAGKTKAQPTFSQRQMSSDERCIRRAKLALSFAMQLGGRKSQWRACSKPSPSYRNCALSASDNSRVGFTTLLYVTYWLCITNQYNHYKNNFAHLLIFTSFITISRLRHCPTPSFSLLMDAQSMNVKEFPLSSFLIVFIPSENKFFHECDLIRNIKRYS